MPIRAVWSCLRLVHFAPVDVMPLLPSMRCIPTVANINRCLVEVVTAVLYKVIQSSHPYPSKKCLSWCECSSPRWKWPMCHSLCQSFGHLWQKMWMKTWCSMPRSTEAAVVVCRGGRQHVTRTMYILLLFNMSVCWRNMRSRRFSPSTRTCMGHLQLPVTWTYSIFLYHMGFLFPPTKLTASIIQASVCCIYKLYYFHKGKSFLSTSILEKQTHLNHRDRGEKWVTCYYTAVRRFRVYFLFVPWHLSHLPCSSSTYQITYQIQTLPHIIVFTCPD